MIMTLQAAGAYIQRLREEARITRHALAKRVNTSDSQVIRIEQGEQETRFSLLALIIRAVDANADDIIDLLLLPDNTSSDGILRADQWIQQRKPKKNGTLEPHPDVLSLLSRLTDYELGRWVALGERLKDPIAEGTKSPVPEKGRGFLCLDIVPFTEYTFRIWKVRAAAS
jgi:transcriptional regulator with XRE-family HTH domain